MSNMSNFSSADQLAEMQAKLNKKLGPEFISQRPGPGGGPKLTYAEGWKIINLANEVFGFNGWSSSVLSITTDYIDHNETTQRYNVGVSAVIRVTLRDGAFHEDVGFGALDNARGKGAALDKCKKEAVTDGIKRTLRNFGNVLGNCLYDKQYVSEIAKVKAPILKLDQDALHRRPDLAGPVPNMPNHGSTPLPSASTSSYNQPTNRNTSRPTGNPSPLVTSTPITNRVLPHNLPTPDTSIADVSISTNRPPPQTSVPRRLQEPVSRPGTTTTTPRNSTSNTSANRVSPPAPTTTTAPAPPAPVRRTSPEPNLTEGELAGELATEGTVYGSDDDAFFDNITPGELDMDVADVPPAPTRPSNAQPPTDLRNSPVVQPREATGGTTGASSTSVTIANATSSTEPADPPRAKKLSLADAIRGGAPGSRSSSGDKRATTPELPGQKRQRTS